MNDKLTYTILKIKLNTFVKNVDLIVSNITSFVNTSPSALVLNNNTNYKNDISNLKYTLEKEKKIIKKEILIEIDKNIIM